MKRLIIAVIAGVSLSSTAIAGRTPPPPPPPYIHFGYTTNPVAVDAAQFENYGTFTNIYTTMPFDTQNTLHFINGDGAMMSGSLGWRFDTVTSTNRKPAMSFNNRGTVEALDKATLYFGISPSDQYGSTILQYGTPSSVASYVQVFASNIVNSGKIKVGDVGLLQLKGNNVDISRGSVSAGKISHDDATNVFYFNGVNWTSDNPGRGINAGLRYLNPFGVEDFFWGTGFFFPDDADSNTNHLADLLRFDTNGVPQPNTPVEFVGELGARTCRLTLPVTGDALFQPRLFIIRNERYTGTNSGHVYTDVNLIFIKTNNIDTNLNINVRCGRPDERFFLFGTNFFQAPVQNMIEFSVTNIDVMTGLPVTNAFWFMEEFGNNRITNILQTNILAPKVPFAGLSWNSRPVGFEITTTVPLEWIDATNASDVVEIPYRTDVFDLDPYIFIDWPSWAYSWVLSSGPSRSWGSIVHRNPETFTGLSYYPQTNDVLNNPYFALKDPTNDPARVEISADKLDATSARVRAEGLLKMEAKHLAGKGMMGVDAGIINGLLGSTNGFLCVSNMLPAEFKRARGGVYAWSADWTREMTAVFNDPFLGTYTTNYSYRYHILVVDHDVKGTFEPTARDITLRGTNTVVQDNLRVIGKSLFDVQNLTFKSKVSMLESNRNFGAHNIPKLRNFLIETNGRFLVENQAFIGTDRADAPAGLNTITNRGLVVAIAPRMKAATVENSGAIVATNGGSISIEALNLTLTTNQFGQAAGTNLLMADRGITIGANTATIVSSTLYSGKELGTLTLNVSTELTDFIPGVSATASNIHNYWEVTDGFLMLQKPDYGDLLCTQIKTMATNDYETFHIWAGEDRGPTSDGFVDNAAIGRLVLSRQTIQSALRFAGAGIRNAMYVNYLELADFCFSDYHNGLTIEDNLTIYFADSNADPEKLQNLYPGRLVWVPDFSGANNTVMVALRDGTFCPMNRALAESANIDSDGDGIANVDDPYPLGDGVVSIGGVPRVTTYLYDSWPDLRSLTIVVSGQGTVVPRLSSAMLVPGTKYTLTAVPAAGNFFAGWRGGIVTTNSTVSFTFQTNLLLEAVFISNPYIKLKGVYSGLFYNPAEVAMESSGFFTFTLNEAGFFSGKLISGRSSFAFKSAFNNYGTANFAFKGPGGVSLTAQMQLDVMGDSERVSGTFTCSRWTAALSGDHFVYANSNPATSAGKYTMALPGGGLPGVPLGDGYGLITVRSNGVVVTSGKLADGTSYSHSGYLSKSGEVPFYVPLYSGKGALLSWINVNGDTFDVTGMLSWIKPKVSSGLYRAGFTNELSLMGSLYLPMTRGFGLGFDDGWLVLNGGNLGTTATFVTLNPRNNTLTNGPVLLQPDRVAGNAGYFTGKFIHPVTHKSTTMQGVLLQNRNEARGCFLGTSESGAVLLQGN